MKKRVVVQTFEPTLKQRRLGEALLAPLGELYVLSDAAQKDREELLRRAEVLFSEQFSSRELSPRDVECCSRLKMIQLLFAGADKVPFSRIPENVSVACNAGGFAEPLAEHVAALVLGLAKKIVPSHNRMREGFFHTSRKSLFLAGKTCGIVGYGGNGRAIGRCMKALGMNVEGINRTGKGEPSCSAMGKLEDFISMVSSWDVIILTLPLTKYTRFLVDARALKAMKPQAILVNVGRGDLVEPEALYGHLCAFPGFSAGVDTWWSEPEGDGPFTSPCPFLDCANFLGSPHRADHVPEMEEYAFVKALENVAAFLNDTPLRGVLSPEEYL